MNNALLQQALDALNESLDLVDDQLQGGIVMYIHWSSDTPRLAAYRKQAEAHMAAIAALKAALAQPVEPATHASSLPMCARGNPT